MDNITQLLVEQCTLSGDVEKLRALKDIEQWQKVGQFAVDDGVAGLLYWHCVQSELELPERIGREWRRLYRDYAGANLAALFRLEQVMALFAARGIDALLLPGAPLLALYPDLGCRSMDDIDLLVQPDRLDEIAAVLDEMGYTSPARHPDIFYSDELVLDIHVDLFHVERVGARRFAGSMPIAEVWRRRSKREVGGFKFDCIGAEDAAIYSAVHVLRHSFRRLNWFVDLHLLCAREVDAEELICRVEAASFEKPMLYALRFLLPYVDLPAALVAWTRAQTMSGVETWFVRKAWADRHNNELGDVLWSFSIGSLVRRLYFILQTLFPRPAVLMQVFPFLPAPLFPLAYALRPSAAVAAGRVPIGQYNEEALTMRCSVKIWALFVIISMGIGCGGKRPPELPPPQSLAPTVAPVMPIDPLYQAYVEKGPFPEYIVGPDDELEIIQRDVKPITEKITVRPDGNISFSLVENLYVAGMTVSELDSALTRALSNYLRDPKIDVQVSEYRSKVVSLLGAIENISQVGVKTGQGRYSLRNKTRLLDVILQAGGATPDAQLDQVQLIRGSGSYTFNLQRVLNTGDPSHNPILQGHDIIIVPGASRLTKKVVVLGEVREPDVYLMANDGSLLEALSRAGGLSEVALSDDIRIIRGTQDGPHMFTVNFQRITSHADLRQNVVLNNNDIIYVPRSFMGDVNDVLSKIDPLLNILLLPATYRQLYTTGGGLRLDTGDAPDASAGTQIFTQPLPGTGTGAGKVVAPDSEEEEEE